ncbi:hypothetical protein HN858_00505 [Candidatus Falkowbacteria bacterium]|jgi:hypothetical protein|nr:hypothetical protein [Candidatus Falkowbacteria bacterium]MBT5503745.1 hypothetical protein [Candidatus Falkowbacteria bacterium]MBT6573776.1 hypothetical protein [Candidatus Falkowbacteria bacterium]MBT7348134.1 hypothetical protein [Candidatus Falkowbacteria bacterium]MBT7500720.1 hypothetical protein [Candidatus Falkowbacteria bacterium]
MRLSVLQKHILSRCYNSRRAKIDRNVFLSFYQKQGRAKKELQVKVITGSIESLIDKELMIGYGVRTSHKWFIKQVSLTNKGKKQAKKLIGEQLSLKLK